MECHAIESWNYLFIKRGKSKLGLLLVYGHGREDYK